MRNHKEPMIIRFWSWNICIDCQSIFSTEGYMCSSKWYVSDKETWSYVFLWKLVVR
ncbi:hypothetical protein RchiOBHm_Chr5g0037491 [Rosa chinensis]|uniref:Uncharacterized protein n=1 Tax=Rosa chinensis TaxID=74649 RepID=A0A2P6QBS2_ROSCH|nr:hypothetical protein RchiOBHm_Chr5g0037491 [Rosa chinensis]